MHLLSPRLTAATASVHLRGDDGGECACNQRHDGTCSLSMAAIAPPVRGRDWL